MTGGKKELIDFLEDSSFREMVFRNKHVIFWREWIKHNPDQKATYDLAVQILREIDEDQESWNPSNKAALLTRINQSQSRTALGLKSKPMVVFQLAILITIMAGGIFWWYWLNPHSSGEFLNEQATTNLEWTVKSNPAGQKSRLTLPDGSKVTLNAASEISYSSDFSKKNREIHLKGEAFFEVAEDSVLVFEVFAGPLVTRAIGTSFNIKNYPHTVQRVQLTSGNVLVRQTDDLQESIQLHPGQEVVLNTRHEIETRDFDMQKATMWMDGILYFHRASFQEVVKTLELWYGVDITIENLPHKSLTVTAEFKKDHLDNVLHSLSFTFEFDYSINNKQVTIQFNPKS